jgi:hypothetical protein
MVEVFDDESRRYRSGTARRAMNNRKVAEGVDED